MSAVTAKHLIGEMVQLDRRVMRVVGHTMTASATCGCGYHHYDLETPASRASEINVCGAKLKAVAAKGTATKPRKVAA